MKVFTVELKKCSSFGEYLDNINYFVCAVFPNYYFTLASSICYIMGILTIDLFVHK